MGTNDFYVLALSFLHSTMHHSMGHGTRKQYYQIGRADFRFEIARYLGKYFCLVIKLFANIFVLANHTIISTYNDDTHLHRFPSHAP